MSATAQSSLTAASPSATSTERGWARNLCCADTEAAVTVTIIITTTIIGNIIFSYLDIFVTGHYEAVIVSSVCLFR